MAVTGATHCSFATREVKLAISIVPFCWRHSLVGIWEKNAEKMTELYEIDLCSYKESLPDTRPLLSEVQPDASANTLPFNISTDIDALVHNVLEHEQSRSLATRAQAFVSQNFRSLKRYSTGYPFMMTAKLRGTPFGLIIRTFDKSSLSLGNISVQTTNLFDLIKYHPSNSGFLDYILANQGEIIDVANDFLARFKSLHPSDADTCADFPVVLAGVSNPRQFYAMKEVRSPGFLIHSLKINDEWQSLCNYYYITINRASNIYTVANIHGTPWIFLKPEDRGCSFLKEVKGELQTLGKKDHVWDATCGVILTPAPPSGLPNDARFWFKKTAEKEKESFPGAEYARNTHETEQVKKLRAEAQAFAERFCTDERLERAWITAVQREGGGDVFNRNAIGPFMKEIHRLERDEFDEDEWAYIDWTKAFPRIDRIAKRWALAKTQALGIDAGHANEWVDIMDEETALENTRDVRQDAASVD